MGRGKPRGSGPHKEERLRLAALAEKKAFQKRVQESIAKDREKDKYWGEEAAFLKSGDNTF